MNHHWELSYRFDGTDHVLVFSDRESAVVAYRRYRILVDVTNVKIRLVWEK